MKRYIYYTTVYPLIPIYIIICYFAIISEFIMEKIEQYESKFLNEIKEIDENNI